MSHTSDSVYTNIFTKLKNSKLRNFVWPIRSNEMIKFIPLVLLMFVITLNQNLVRVIKDNLVIIKVGGEVISFIKLWVEMPIGILFVLIYTKLCNHFSTERVFQFVISFLLLCFILLGFFALPNAEIIQPSQDFVNFYTKQYPHLRWFIVMISKWVYVIFYAFAELWTVIVLTLLFWQLANKVTNTDEAKRFYPFFGLFSHSNLIVCGAIVQYLLSAENVITPIFIDEFIDRGDATIKSLVFIIFCLGTFTLIVHKFVEMKIVKNKDLVCQSKNQILKLTVMQSIKTILRSRYLILITITMVSYSVAVNLIEGLWLTKAKQYYPTSAQYMSYQANIIAAIGWFCLISDMICNYTIRRFGWFLAAVSTPIVSIFAGVMFFMSVSLEKYIPYFTDIAPLAVIAYIGLLQNMVIKGFKYSLFDDSKEMLYIPLDNEMKTKGKAAVDIIGAKLGRSIGALLQFIIFTIFPSARYDNIIEYLMVFFIIICLVWIYATHEIKSLYYKKLI